jgi:hypothetical protein
MCSSLPPAAMAKAIAFATPHRRPPPAGVPKPPANTSPALGPGADLRCAGSDGLCHSVPQGPGKRSAFPAPARRGGGRLCHASPTPRPHGKGHRLCHSATLPPRAARGQSPRPAPAPPMAGASRPPGRALAFVARGETVFAAPSRAGGGNAVRFLVPAQRGGGRWCHASPRRHGKGHRLCHAATSPPASRGPKAPGQRPPRHRRALLARRVGRWPAVRGMRRSFTPFRRGGGNAMRFLGPARRGGETGGSPLNAAGHPRLLSEEILVTISPGACVPFTRWSCDRRKEIQMR